MYKKINDYIDYIFKLNNLKNDELKAEVNGNLISKYDDLLNQGLNQEKAYIETIKTIGDFNLDESNIKEKFTYKTNWANIAMTISLALAVIATIALFLHTPTSIIVFAISISFYVGAAYYLYHESQHVMKVEKDVLKHNELLKSIFTYLKTVFIFWSVNISYWLSSIITDNVLYNFILYSAGSGNLDPTDIFGLFMFRLIIAVIFFVILLFLSIVIYNNLESKYYDLTKDNNLKSYLETTSFLKFNVKLKNIIKTVLYTLLTVIYILFIVFYKFHIIVTEGSLSIKIYAKMTEFPTTFSVNIIYIASVILLFGGIITLIISLIKEKRILTIPTFGLLILSQILFSIYVIDQTNKLSYSIDSFFYIKILILVIILYGLKTLIHFKKRKKK